MVTNSAAMNPYFLQWKIFMTNMRNCFIGNGPQEGTIGFHINSENIYSLLEL